MFIYKNYDILTFGSLQLKIKNGVILMNLKFTKMHGCGNDYIYIDCINNNVKFNVKDVAVKLSDRHFGVGSDGVVLILPSNENEADVLMRMYNADGSEGKMCGNAIRCVAKYVYENNIAKKDILKIETLSGIKTIELIKNEHNKISAAKVNMGRADFSVESMPLKTSKKEIVDEPVSVDGKYYKITCISMGNPHCVVFVDDVNGLDVNCIGEKFQHINIFKDEFNIEFVNIISKNEVNMRVYERGSKETLACGTGACATVAAMVKNSYCSFGDIVLVNLLGGTLKVCCEKDRIYMTGEAKKVFTGEIDI